MTDNDSVIPRKYYIEILKPKCIGTDINALNDTILLSMLEDSETDWAANLILYAKYKKDAVFFVLYKDMSDWALIGKCQDTQYWIELIENKR